MNRVFLHEHCYQDDGYCAVIAVKTPAFDDSGVSHAIEHLVFRQTKGSHEPSLLFQLSSFFPITINATTTDEFTFYHCYSPDKSYCLLATEFLLSAISNFSITQQDLFYELAHFCRDTEQWNGVIARELINSQQQIRIAGCEFDSGQLISTDPSSKRSKLVAGTLNSVALITINDLKRYYHQQYIPENITILSGCPQSDRLFESQIHDMLAQSSWHNTSSKNAYSPLEQARTIFVESPPNAQLYELRWQLPANMYPRDSMLEWANRAIACADDVVVLSAQEKFGTWTLRILSSSDQCHSITKRVNQYLINYVAKADLKSADGGNDTKKHGYCDYLISQFIEKYSLKPSPYNPIEFTQRLLSFANHAVDYPCAPAEGCPLPASKVHPSLSNKQLQHTRQPREIDQSRVVSNKPHAALYINKKMPLIIQPLSSQGTINSQVSFNLNKDHFLIEYTAQKDQILSCWCLSIMLGGYPEFLGARYLGQCYAISAGFNLKTRHFFIYSAFNSDPASGRRYFVNCLKKLIENKQFFESSLILAKVKIDFLVNLEQWDLSSQVSSEKIHQVIDKMMQSTFDYSED